MARKRDDGRPAIPGPGSGVYLTRGQIEVLELTAQGLSFKQIALHLRISRRTVEDRFAEMRKRTGASTSYELIAWVVMAGIVVPCPVPPFQRASRLAPGVRPWLGAIEQDGISPAISDNRDKTGPVLSQCRACGTPVAVAMTGRPRTYCSQACRARAYRMRQRAPTVSSSSALNAPMPDQSLVADTARLTHL